MPAAKAAASAGGTFAGSSAFAAVADTRVEPAMKAAQSVERAAAFHRILMFRLHGNAG
jgi:hypothetical protein